MRTFNMRSNLVPYSVRNNNTAKTRNSNLCSSEEKLRQLDEHLMLTLGLNAEQQAAVRAKMLLVVTNIDDFQVNTCLGIRFFTFP